MDSGEWFCHRCGQRFRSFDVPELVPTEHGNQFIHRECPVFKMPSAWSEQLGLPDVGPIWKDYPITEAEFRARQGKWDAAGHRLT